MGAWGKVDQSLGPNPKSVAKVGTQEGTAVLGMITTLAHWGSGMLGPSSSSVGLKAGSCFIFLVTTEGWDSPSSGLQWLSSLILGILISKTGAIIKLQRPARRIVGAQCTTAAMMTAVCKMIIVI